MSTMAQSRLWDGPPVFSYGFRPFFLAGSAYAALVMVLWVPWYLGAISIPTTFDPTTWHMHELLFGFVPAVVAGFLLTAVPNWTGRLPVVGYPLITLFLLWAIGRLAVAGSAWLDPISLAVLTFAFPILLLFVTTREVIKGNNVKNLIVVAAASVLVVAQATVQYAHWTGGNTQVGGRLGIAGTVILIMIIGGRITPSFTRNWIKKANPGREPAQIGRYDSAALLMGTISLLLWAFAAELDSPLSTLVAVLLIATGIMHFVRQARWAPDRTLREPLVLVLHVGYVFVPIGFVLSGLALIEPLGLGTLAGTHAWAAGAIGVMTLAVMTRASLGHTGRTLTASRGTVMLYAAATLAALTRIAAALMPEYSLSLLELSAALWCIAFAGFAVLYGPILVAKRVSA